MAAYVAGLSPVFNHIQNDFAREVKSKDALSQLLNRALYCAAYVTPLAGALVPKAGISLRLITDLSDFATITQLWGEPLIKSICSGLSAYCIFFAPLYSRHAEVVHSFVMHLRDLAQGPKDQTGLQPMLHILIDFINFAVLTSGGLELRLASHLLQLCVGLIDCKEEWDNSRLFGVAVHLGLSALRLNALITVGQKFYQVKNLVPIQAQTVISNPSSGNILEAACLYQQGTGSEELAKLTFLKYLGREGFSGDLFLVQDEEGNTKILKKLFSEADKIQKSGAYAFVSVLFFPMTLVNICYNSIITKAKDALAISQLKDPNVVQIFKIIQNTYTKDARAAEDIYMLMEPFEGISLDKWKGSLPVEMVQRIAATLSNIAHSMNYFYNGDGLNIIKVSGNALKFVSFDYFYELNAWTGCLNSYDHLHKFFAKLVCLLPEKEKWVKELDLIFNHRGLVEKYKMSAGDYKKTLEQQCKNIFNSELLKETLIKIQALFTPAG